MARGIRYNGPNHSTSCSKIKQEIILKKLIALAFVVLYCLSASIFAQGDADISPHIYATEESQASMKDYGSTLCDLPGYRCHPIEKDDTWTALWPDFLDRAKVMRLNRTNVALMYRNWIVVPDHLSQTSYMAMSPLPFHRNTHHKKLIVVDLKLFAFGAYDAKGNLLYWGPASGGRDQCPDVGGQCLSKTGKFKIYRIRGADCTSQEYPLETHGGAPMPYCMYYYKGFALHGSTLSGFINRSRGCVRLFYDDAKWLYEQFAKIGTQVIVRR